MVYIDGLYFRASFWRIDTGRDDAWDFLICISYIIFSSPANKKLNVRGFNNLRSLITIIGVRIVDKSTRFKASCSKLLHSPRTKVIQIYYCINAKHILSFFSVVSI